MMGSFYNMGWGGGYGFGWIFMFLFWGLIIWAIVVLIKNYENKNTDNVEAQREKVLNILKERYAKGEINKEDFERIKKDLQ